MTDGRITDEEIAELVQRTQEATAAFMRGDMDRYLALTPHARGFTPMIRSAGHPPATTTGPRACGRRRSASGAAMRSSRSPRCTPGATP